MNVPWNDDRCIICMQRTELSIEHVIPQSLGGILCCKFLCKPCNDHLGHRIEAQARFDPAIRLAIANLRSELPRLYATIEERQKYSVDVGPTKFCGILKSDQIRGAEGRIEDGSVIKSEANTPATLKVMLSRDGCDPDFIERALKKYEKAAPGVSVQLSPTISIRKWNNRPAEPLYSGPDLSPLVILKIAYEFLALCIGSGILADNLPINQIRMALQTANEKSISSLIERKIAPKYGTMHGICFHGNSPEAIIEVRLFRKLAYLVRLPYISLQIGRGAYTHDLKTNEDWFRVIDQDEN